MSNPKDRALDKAKKLKVEHKEGGKLYKMTHFDKAKVKFTGKGGFAKNFGK